MVLTGGQTTFFFENIAQMAIPHRTRVQLKQEGIDSVDDLVDFDKDSFKQVGDNLRRPGGRVQNTDQGATPGSTMPTPPFLLKRSRKCGS